MVAIGADHGLKPRRQKARIFGLQMFRACGADEQVGKNTGQTQHPNFEVTRGEFDRASFFKSSNGHEDQPEDRILRLVLRQKSIDQFHQARGANRAIVVLEKLHGRIQEIGGLNPHQIPVFLFEKLNSGMGQRLQRRAKPVFHPARPVCDASQLAMIAAEKSDDPIGLSERVCLQYNRVALMETHNEIPGKGDHEK